MFLHKLSSLLINFLGEDEKRPSHESSKYTFTTGATYLPKAKTPSSSRVRAAYACHNEFLSRKGFGKGKRRIQKKVHCRNKKLQEDLICFEVREISKTYSLDFLKNNDVFVDGGDVNNEVINPRVT